MLKQLQVKDSTKKKTAISQPANRTAVAPNMAVAANLAAATKASYMAGKPTVPVSGSNKPANTKQAASKTAAPKPKDQEIICIDIE